MATTLVLVALVAPTLGTTWAWAAPGTTERVSVSSDGIQGNGPSTWGWFGAGGRAPISADGRFVAFESRADNLVAGDTNGTSDVFVHDRLSRRTERVSVGTGGVQAHAASDEPAVNADGRFVAFESWARLVPADTNGQPDIYVHDRATATTERVSVASDGTQTSQAVASPTISGDGRYVAFWTSADTLVPGDVNGELDVFVHDRVSRETRLVSVSSAGIQGNGASGIPTISRDGRYVAFSSSADNLVPGDTNGQSDLFVRDLVTGTTELVSVDPGGAPANGFSDRPSLSDDGRYVAFHSDADNLVTGDTNGDLDVFVRDRATATTHLIGVSVGGTPLRGATPALTGDGRYVALAASAFDSGMHAQVFVRDRHTGTTQLVSMDSAETPGDDGSFSPSISDDGRFVSFSSAAANLVPGDTNGVMDVFVHERADAAPVDSDGDGIPDDRDVEGIQARVAALPDTSFRAGSAHGHRTAITSILDDVEAAIAAGDTATALEQLRNLRRRVDGCGAVADLNDWITNCTDQQAVRELVDLLITNLTT